MWFGTEYGLNRFDGYRFKHFFKKDISYSSDNISSLQEDSWGNIWIDMGVFTVYDWKTDSFIEGKQVLNTMGVECENLRHVFVDNQKCLCVEADNKLYVFEHNKSFKAYTLPFTTGIWELTKIDSQVYLSTYLALYKLDIRSGVFTEQVLPNISGHDIPVRRTLYTYADKSNDLWLYSKEENNLWRKRYYSDTFDQIKFPSCTANCRIRDVIDDNKGNIWIATDNQGVFILDKNSGKFHNEKNDRINRSSLSSSNINDLYVDSDGIVWIAHFRSGVSYMIHNLQNILKADLRIECSVAKIIEDSKSNLWLGTDGEGLLQQENDNQFNSIDKILSKNIIAIHEDSRQRIWAGTFLGGLFCYDNGKAVRFTTENTNLPENNIWDIKEDRFKNIWLAFLTKGVWMFNEKTRKATPAFKHIPAIASVTQLFYDEKDSLFAATNAGIGILNVKTGKDTAYVTNRAGTQSFRHHFVRTVYKDSRGWLWMGFAGELIVWNLKTDQFLFIEEKDGLCNNLINGITEDKNHHIWVSTAKGLSNIIIKDIGKDGKPVMLIQNYTTEDGLLDNDCGYIMCRKDGNLLICSQNGYTVMLPNLTTDEITFKKPIFTDVWVDNQQIPYSQLSNNAYGESEITVSSGFLPQNHLIRIDFSTLDFNNLHRQKYAYQIDGQMNEWIETNDSYILLNQLKSGDYKLKVKVCNSNGIWSDEYSAIRLHIQPPFWMTQTAYLFYILLIIACLYWSGKHFYNKREKKCRSAV